MSVICVFGDSIVWGAYDLELGGWVNRLKLYLNNLGNFDTDVYNFGVSGDKVKDVLKRIDIEAKSIKPDKIIFAIGINDSPHLAHLFGTKLTDFENQFRQLLEKAKKFTENIVIVGLINVAENTKLHGYSNQKIEKYNQVVEKIAQEENLLFVGQFFSLSNEDFEDGLHPNSKAHQKIFEKVKEILEK